MSIIFEGQLGRLSGWGVVRQGNVVVDNGWREPDHESPVRPCSGFWILIQMWWKAIRGSSNKRMMNLISIFTNIWPFWEEMVVGKGKGRETTPETTVSLMSSSLPLGAQRQAWKVWTFLPHRASLLNLTGLSTQVRPGLGGGRCLPGGCVSSSYRPSQNLQGKSGTYKPHPSC